jgi:hypothetical protein
MQAALRLRLCRPALRVNGISNRSTIVSRCSRPSGGAFVRYDIRVFVVHLPESSFADGGLSPALPRQAMDCRYPASATIARAKSKHTSALRQDVHFLCAWIDITTPKPISRVIAEVPP